MKALAAGIGVVFLSPLLLGTGAMMMATSSEAAQNTASPLDCLTNVDTSKIADQVTEILDGADASKVHIKGLDLPAEQIPNAQRAAPSPGRPCRDGGRCGSPPDDRGVPLRSDERA
ncbi:hypothetical protein ACF1GS_38130 [Streptomyces eurythermus]|uniref:hypothetical protein n=1 Tax=Streptomyces eurythermus TaxID=42237 RepID=UPI0036FE2415